MQFNFEMFYFDFWGYIIVVGVPKTILRLDDLLEVCTGLRKIVVLMVMVYTMKGNIVYGIYNVELMVMVYSN